MNYRIYPTWGEQRRAYTKHLLFHHFLQLNDSLFYMTIWILQGPLIIELSNTWNHKLVNPHYFPSFSLFVRILFNLESSHYQFDLKLLANSKMTRELQHYLDRFKVHSWLPPHIIFKHQVRHKDPSWKYLQYWPMPWIKLLRHFHHSSTLHQLQVL